MCVRLFFTEMKNRVAGVLGLYSIVLHWYKRHGGVEDTVGHGDKRRRRPGEFLFLQVSASARPRNRAEYKEKMQRCAGVVQ